MKTRRAVVTALAGPAIHSARDIYLYVPVDAVRVAALVDIAGAAAALARTVVRLRHLDPDLIAPHVADRADLRAVLGRGQWLPTMIRAVPEPQTPTRSVQRRAARRRSTFAQTELFLEGR